MPTPTGLWLTVLTLAAPAAPDAHDLHAATEALWDGLPWPHGARPLWSQPRPDTLVVQGPAPLTQPPARWTLTAHSTPVTIPPAGAAVSLSLIANPTRVTTHHAPDGTERKPRTPLPATEWDTWLTRHLHPALTLTPGTTGHRTLPAARGHHHGRAGTITHARTLFHADATVTDPELLTQLVTAGVGHGKAYGCGLLLTRQVRT